MAERDKSGPIVPLTAEQKQKILDDLNNRGAGFFSWEQLQALMLKYGPNTTLGEIMETIRKEQENKKIL